MSKYRNTIYYDFKFRFLVIFSCNYQHRQVLKIPFPTIFFPKPQNFVLKIFFPHPSRNTSPPPPMITFMSKHNIQIPNPFLAKSVLLDEKQYVINSMVEKAAYSVLQLSLYPCILNPIEVARASLECLYK